MKTKNIFKTIITVGIAVIAAGCGGGSETTGVPKEVTELHAKVLTANVGNADILNCSKYLYKLCLNSLEKTLSANIAAHNPDIIAFQEVADSHLCNDIGTETDSMKVCFDQQKKSVKDQVRRLLGANYTIVCDGRNNFECIGIKVGYGTVEGCGNGQLCITSAAITHDVSTGCDSKAALFGIDVSISRSTYRLVNAHPQATGESCRADQLKRMFEGYGDVSALAPLGKSVIVMGDMNMDPYRDDPTNTDVIAWKNHVGTGKPFYYLSGIAEHNPPYKTSITGSTLDHVVSNFAMGSCATLGQAPGTTRLDGITIGTDYYQPESNDHLAVYCDLTLK